MKSPQEWQFEHPDKFATHSAFMAWIAAIQADARAGMVSKDEYQAMIKAMRPPWPYNPHWTNEDWKNWAESVFTSLETLLAPINSNSINNSLTVGEAKEGKD